MSKKRFVAISLVLALWPALALSKPGALDRSFSRDGKVRTLVTEDFDEAQAVGIQSTGKTVAAGWGSFADGHRFVLVRYTRAGKLDKTFGGDGIVTTNFGANQIEEINGLRVMRSDKIVVVGKVSPTFDDADMVVARYRPNGGLDDSFDDDGKLRLSLTPESHNFSDLTLFSNGSIGVVGTFDTGSGWDTFAARIDADGDFITRFNGGVTIDNFEAQDWFEAAAAHRGKLVAAGSSGGKFLIARFTRDGAPDPAFGENGGYTALDIDPTNLDEATGLLVLPNDKILVVGTTGPTNEQDIAVVRFKADGTRDNSFDTDAIVVKDYGSDYAAATSVTPQPLRRFIVSGSLNRDSASDEDFLAVRYNPNGSVDTSFGRSGQRLVDFGGPIDRSLDAAAHPDGRTVMAGQAGNCCDYHVGLVRLKGDVYTKLRVKLGTRLVARGTQFPALPGRKIVLTLLVKRGGDFEVADRRTALLRRRVDVNGDGFKESRFRKAFGRPSAATCRVKARFPGGRGYSPSTAVKTFAC